MRLAAKFALIAFLCLVTCAARASASDQALIILNSASLPDTQATIATLEARGIRVGHVIPPGALIVNVPVQLENQIAALPDVVGIYRGPVAITSGFDSDVSAAVSAWNHLISPAPQEELPPGRPLVGDALLVPAMNAAGSVSAATNAPGTYQTSSFMIGKVAVGVVLPESNGGSEDWSAARQSDVFNRIVSGLDWWVGKGGSAAHLTFYYEQRFSVPTQYEPISMAGMADEETWVSDIFASMGYTAGLTRFDRARAYDNDLRRTYHTDWAYTFIVVDSLNDPDGQFADGYFAWAYMLGPYVVMTYDNDSYTISRMSVVVTHETGHVFGAADEYCSPGYSCCDFRSYGYLDVYNGNCEKGNPSSVPCIMRDCGDNVCLYTSGQVGWRDSDSDGKPDPIDTPVGNAIAGQMDSQTSPWDMSLAGTANEIPYPSAYGSVTINKISGVRFRIDSGQWRDAIPPDGAFDEDIEDYVVTASGLDTGDHQVETQAFSTSGNSSDIAFRTVYVPQIGYSVLPAEFEWVDPSRHAALPMSDDSVSPPQMMPFPFSFYGTTYNQFYVGANGLLGFAGDDLDSYVNLAIPSVATPNAAIYAHWDDLDPSAGGSVRVGVVGKTPHRRLVVSWVGVPHFLTTSYMTFQALLCEDISDIILQYLEVEPGDGNFGAGRSATVGIESVTGTRAAQYSLNGTPLLSNGQAVLFTTAPSISCAKNQPDGQSVELSQRAVVLASQDVFYIEDDARTSGIRVSKPNHGLSRGMKAYVKGTLATDANGERYIAATIAIHYGDGSVKPLFVTNSALRPPLAPPSQGGVSVVGLLVRTTGRVTTVGPGYVYIDDGSGLRDGTDTAGIANVGVRAACDQADYAPGDVISVTGVCSCFAGGSGRPARQVLVNDAGDINVERSHTLGKCWESSFRQVWICWR